MQRLAVIWFSGAAFLFLLLFIQTVLGRYVDRVEDVWSWFASVLVPVLTLIAGAFFSNKLGTGSDRGKVNPSVYRIAAGMSTIYLLVINATVLLSPFSPIPALELMNLSELWLELFQGLLTMALGVFFVGRSSEHEAAPAALGR